MHRLDGQLVLSPTDLTHHQECEHLTRLDLGVAAGEWAAPEAAVSEEVQFVFDRGLDHEKKYLESLKAAVETGLGKRPALSDVKGFQQVGKSGDTRFLTAYVDTAGAAGAMLTFFRAVGRGNSQGFDTGDVDATIAPLCEAMKKLPPYGGGLAVDGTVVAGQFQPLPVQQ